MKSKLLLPNKYKKLGWIILIPATILGVIIIAKGYEASWLNAKVFAILNDEVFGKSSHFSFIKTNVTNTFIGILFIVGAMLVSFSKEKQEDEFIAELRLNSLLWAVAANYMLLLLAFIFVYGTPFLSVMIYNMFTTLIIFIARFHFLLYKNSKTLPNEK